MAEWKKNINNDYVIRIGRELHKEPKLTIKDLYKLTEIVKEKSYEKLPSKLIIYTLLFSLVE